MFLAPSNDKQTCNYDLWHVPANIYIVKINIILSLVRHIKLITMKSKMFLTCLRKPIDKHESHSYANIET